MVSRLVKAAVIISAALAISLSGAAAARAQTPTPVPSNSREQLTAEIKGHAQRHFQSGGPMQAQVVLEVFRDNAAGLTPAEITSIYEEEYARQKEGESFFKRGQLGLIVAVAVVGFLIGIFGGLLRDSAGRTGEYVFRSLYRRFGGTMLFRFTALKYYRRALSRKYHLVKLPFNQGVLNFREMFVPPALMNGHNGESIDALRAVKEFSRLVILGPPGSGKSTLLTYIASTYAEGTPDSLPNKSIPVLLELARLNGETRTLEEHIAHVFTLNDFRNSEAFVEEALLKGRLLLLLDGFDGIAPAQRPQAVVQIKNLLESYPQTRAVITSRIAVYRDEFRDAVDDTLTILDLNDQRIQRFLNAWGPLMPDGKSAAQFMQSLRDRPRLMALARNWLLLTLIVYFYTSTDDPLPSSRAELYRQMARTLLDSWHNERNAFKLPVKRIVLERLALQIQDGGSSSSADRLSMDHTTVSRLIEEVLPSLGLAPDDGSKILDEIVEGSGLLLSIDGGARFQFSHLTLQEYFCASALTNEPDGLVERFARDPYPWREVVNICCGLLDDGTYLLKSLYPIDPLTAFECLADARRVDAGLTETMLAAMKDRLGEDEGYEEVTRAFAAVASSTGRVGERVFGQLEETLKADESPRRRQAAAEALSLTNMPRAAALLASCYLTHPEVRLPLIHMGDLAVPVLQALAQAGVDQAATDAVLGDLRAIGTPAAAEALVPLLSKQLKNLSGRSLDVAIDGRSGFYVKKKEELRLRVRNLLDEPIEDVLVELEDTAKYSVDGADGGGAHATRLTLPAGASQVLSYPLLISEPGQLDLQLKVNGKVYKDHPLELYATRDNPYIYGPPITDRYNYFGREEEFNTILNGVQGETGPHRLLIGEQRSGKTSFLYILKDTIRNPVVPVYITLENMPGSAGGGDEIAAFRWILDRLIYELKELGALDREKEYPTEMKYADYFGRHLRSLIRELQGATPGARLCLLIDEGNRILKLREEFQLVMRATLNELGRDMRMVLACSNEFLEHVQESHSSPFKNVFQYTVLRPIGDGDLRLLITEPARRFGYEYEEAAVRRVRELSGGHPYYVQALCADAFDHARRASSARISLTHIKAAEADVVNSKEIRDKFVLGYWNVLKDDPEALRCLLRLSEGEDAGKSPTETLDKLKARQLIVEVAPQRYEFSAELFRIWVKQLSDSREMS
jgi:energy-coupling factor transporter ATP-binding protein EcfA2